MTMNPSSKPINATRRPVRSKGSHRRCHARLPPVMGPRWILVLAALLYQAALGCGAPLAEETLAGTVRLDLASIPAEAAVLLAIATDAGDKQQRAQLDHDGAGEQRSIYLTGLAAGQAFIQVSACSGIHLLGSAHATVIVSDEAVVGIRVELVRETGEKRCR